NTALAGSLRHVTNPIVKAAMWQLRQVVNAILREHFKDGSKPDAIHVEMVRELKQTSVMRKIATLRRKEQEAVREDAKASLKELSVVPTADAIRKYCFWIEQDMRCAYSGKCIPPHLLFSEDGVVQIDHI